MMVLTNNTVSTITEICNTCVCTCAMILSDSTTAAVCIWQYYCHRESPHKCRSHRTYRDTNGVRRFKRDVARRTDVRSWIRFDLRNSESGISRYQVQHARDTEFGIQGDAVNIFIVPRICGKLCDCLWKVAKARLRPIGGWVWVSNASTTSCMSVAWTT